FFFSSRRRHTRFSRDWSSDVCSSDLYLFFTASTNVGLSNSGLHMSAYDRSPAFNVYAFILSKNTPTIFKNESDEETVKEEKKEDKKEEPKKEDKKDDKKSETAKKADASKPDDKNLEVDFDNINRRIIALPLQPGYYSVDGNVDKMLIYRRGSIIGAFDLEKAEDKTVVDNAGSFVISADGKRMLYQSGRDYFITNAGQKPAPNTGKVDLDNIQIEVDPSAEWKQIFNEVWAMQKEFFD